MRSFNDTVRAVFAMTPTDLRSRAGRGDAGGTVGAVAVRLPYRPPLCACCLLDALATAAWTWTSAATGSAPWRPWRAYAAQHLVTAGRDVSRPEPEPTQTT